MDNQAIISFKKMCVCSIKHVCMHVWRQILRYTRIYLLILIGGYYSLISSYCWMQTCSLQIAYCFCWETALDHSLCNRRFETSWVKRQSNNPFDVLSVVVVCFDATGCKTHRLPIREVQQRWAISRIEKNWCNNILFCSCKDSSTPIQLL